MYRARRYIPVLMICLVIISTALSAPEMESVESINKKVSSISDSIRDGKYMLFMCQDNEPSEGIQPVLKYYYKGARLVALISLVGHESWSNEFHFFYYPNGKVMKYLKITSGQTDKAVRSGIIYDQTGKILWKNTDEPVIDGKKMIDLYNTIQKCRLELSKY